jgi:hypothetical protein
MKISPVGKELFHTFRGTVGRTDGETDMTKVITTIRNFAKAPKLFPNLNALYLLFSFRGETLILMARIIENFRNFLKTFNSLSGKCNTLLAHEKFRAINLTSPRNKFVFSDVFN